jgi:hypothetical protein
MQAAYPNLTQMAIMIFTTPPMSAGPVFLVVNIPSHLRGYARLGATMVKMVECLKSWIGVTPGRQQAPLSDVIIEGFVYVSATRPHNTWH